MRKTDKKRWIQRLGQAKSTKHKYQPRNYFISGGKEYLLLNCQRSECPGYHLISGEEINKWL